MFKLLSTKTNQTTANIGLFILRLFVGGLMIRHGYQKLVGFDEFKTKFIDFMGLGQSVSLGLTIFAEFFCALFVVLGLFTRFSLIPLIIAMGVALFIAHKGEAFGEGEMAALYFGSTIALFIMGPGKFSVDALISKN